MSRICLMALYMPMAQAEYANACVLHVFAEAASKVGKRCSCMENEDDCIVNLNLCFPLLVYIF